jgi:hypothetical protein
LVPVIALAIGLVALGVDAEILQRSLDDLGGGTFALLMGASLFGLWLVPVSTWTLLSSLLPTPAYSPMSRRDGLLGGLLLPGGILIAVPFSICAIGSAVGVAERSPLSIPLLMLNAVGVSCASWFFRFCLGHLIAQDRPVLFKGMWLVLLILGNLVAMPIYWYAFARRPQVSHPFGGCRSR